MKFGTYYYKETCQTLKPVKSLEFVGQSLPYYNSMRAEIESVIGNSIPLHKVDISEFYKVHTKEYLDAFIARSRGEDVDIPFSMECLNLEYALFGYEYSLGGLHKSIDMMKEGRLDRAYCFAMPSHHAHPGKGHGYCALNTMAAGVRYAQKCGFSKILIVDWDIHHGDGTQTIFENDPDIHHISLHSAVDLYMSMVGSTSLGTTTYAESVGHVNIPVLDSHYTRDFFYKDLELTGEVYSGAEAIPKFSEALNNLPFDPDLIMIFDGHDSHVEDCGRNITDWENGDFKKLTKMMIDKSLEFQCPILSMPGGGYVLEKTVELSIQHANLLKKYRS